MSQFFFAWVDASENVFGPQHHVEDEDIFSVDFKHEEGDFATLTLIVRNPRIGFLSTTRKVWAWFSHSDGVIVTPIFFGRLVAVPTDILAELVQMEFVARPADFLTQKETLANSLRTLPAYDPIWFTPEERVDPDIVLNGRSAHWHINPITHALSISDVLNGEDGVLDFSASQVLFNSVKINISGIPITTVRVFAAMNWQQVVSGNIDLTGIDGFLIRTFTPEGILSGWPKSESSIGGGWYVDTGYAYALHDFEVTNKSFSSDVKTPSPEEMGDDTTMGVYTNFSTSEDKINKRPEGSFTTNEILTERNNQETRDKNTGELQSATFHTAYTEVVVPQQSIVGRLSVKYAPDRRQTETVEFLVQANIQPIVTLPEGQDIVNMEFDSVTLNELIDGVSPLVDSRRRSYITYPRGLSSIEYLIMVARATILNAARVVKVDYELVSINDWFATTLRKNSIIHDGRLPGGQGEGKIIARRFALDGSTGKQSLGVTMGSAVGFGGTVVAEPGEPTWAEAAYVGNDYQVYEGAVNSLGDVGYTVPIFNSQDDGINFTGSGMSSYDATRPATTAPKIVFTSGWFADEQKIVLDTMLPDLLGEIQGAQTGEAGQALVNALPQKIQAALEPSQTFLKWRFFPLNGEWVSPYVIGVSDVFVPQQINLGD